MTQLPFHFLRVPPISDALREFQESGDATTSFISMLSDANTAKDGGQLTQSAEMAARTNVNAIIILDGLLCLIGQNLGPNDIYWAQNSVKTQSRVESDYCEALVGRVFELLRDYGQWAASVNEQMTQSDSERMRGETQIAHDGSSGHDVISDDGRVVEPNADMNESADEALRPLTQDNVVPFETTAEISSPESGADKATQFLLQALDIFFFLGESLFKATGPVLVDGGALASKRAQHILFQPLPTKVGADIFNSRMTEVAGFNRDRGEWKLILGLEPKDKGGN
jgi:hypothetical protein